MDNLDGMSHEQLLRYAKHYKKQIGLLKEEKQATKNIKQESVVLHEANKQLIETLTVANNQLEKAINTNRAINARNADLQRQIETVMVFIEEFVNTHPDGEQLVKVWNHRITKKGHWSYPYEDEERFIDIDDPKFGGKDDV